MEKSRLTRELRVILFRLRIVDEKLSQDIGGSDQWGHQDLKEAIKDTEVVLRVVRVASELICDE